MRSLLMGCLAVLVGCHDAGSAAYLAQAQLTLLDLAGSWFAPAAQPRTHLLFLQTRLPAGAGSPQYIDPDFTATSGCVVNRYDEGGQPIPNVDQPAGDISYSGFATTLLAADGSAPPPGVYAPPIPASVNCTKDMLKPYYACRAGDPGGPEKIAGEDPARVRFPAVSAAAWSAMCPGCGPCDAQQVPDGAGGMAAVCEQHPLPEGAVVTENLSGGGGYSALTAVALPPLGGTEFFSKIVRIVVGAAEVPSLEAVTLDGVHDLSFQWSCDPSASTVPGVAQCPRSVKPDGSVNVLALYAVTSAAPREAFAPGARYSVAQCYVPIDDPRATLTLSKDAIQTLLGGQPGGSLFLSVSRMNLRPQTSLDHTVFLGAGRGQFAVLDYGNPGALDLSAVVDSGTD